jgi:hypothetical protein
VRAGAGVESRGRRAPGRGLGDLAAGLAALADQFALELGERGEQVQLPPAGGGRGADRLP